MPEPAAYRPFLERRTGPYLWPVWVLLAVVSESVGVWTITVLFGPAASSGYRVVGTLLGIPFALLMFGCGVVCTMMAIDRRGRRVVVEGPRLTADNFLGVRSAGRAAIASIDLRPRVWIGGRRPWALLVSLREGKDVRLDVLIGRGASRPPAPEQLAMLHDIRARLGVDGPDGTVSDSRVGRT